jgi:riboflavin synthase
MFTGIIEDLGIVKSISKEGTNLHFTIESEVSSELKIDQSISHNGVCLTVVKLPSPNSHVVTAIEETLVKSNLLALEIGGSVNLERCMQMNGRLDGHIVQGHVDQIGTVKSITEKDGSWFYDIEYDGTETGNITVEKGSICVNGVSLTAFNSTKSGFTVAIIPFTHEHTCFKNFKVGSTVNLEFDILGKYIKSYMNQMSL